jgi:hypothetical protein
LSETSFPIAQTQQMNARPDREEAEIYEEYALGIASSRLGVFRKENLFRPERKNRLKSLQLVQEIDLRHRQALSK